MAIRLPPDIEELVAARVESGEFASPEDVLRSALAPWIAREQSRSDAIAKIRAKIAEGDADETDFSPSAVREHLDKVMASLQSRSPDAWPAAGFVDTEIGCFMKPEVAYAAKTVWA